MYTSVAVGADTAEVGENVGASEMPGNDVVRRQRKPQGGSTCDTCETVTLKRLRGSRRSIQIPYV
jgi:hypothetical protein